MTEFDKNQSESATIYELSVTNIETENIEITSEPIKRKETGPKKFLKDLQQRFYSSPSLYLSFCFIVPVVMMYLMYIANATFPFGETSPLVLDLNAQYVHFFTALRQFVYGDNSLLYSFARSLGGEFMGIYAYYMASPLTYIVALFPIERMQEAVLCIMLLKTGLSGLTFGYYLHKKSRKPNRLVIFTFSLLYALSAYAVIHQNNTMWIDALILLPLFVYGLEALVTKRKYKLYVITFSLILISNYYIGYMVCIFAVMYFFYYYFSKSATEINPRNEKLHFVKAASRFALFSALSAAISAFMLIVAYYSLGFGKSEFSNPSWTMEGNFQILDFLIKFLPGSYDTVEPSGLPFVYCGLITLFLVPVYFISKKVSSREKIASAALIAVFLLSLLIVPLDLIWHGFSAPNWLNARYSFMFCFVLLVLAYKGFSNLRAAGEKFILGIGAVILALVVVAEKSEFKSFINSKEKLDTLGCIWFSVFFVICLVVLLCLKIKIKSKSTSRCISYVLCAVICVEILCNGIVCFFQFDKDVSFSNYSSYDNFFSNLRPVVDQIKAQDSGFYRMEKTTHRTKNDNMTLGINGITNSTSTLNSEAITLVNKLGYTGRAHLTMYRGGTPFSDSILGIKYVIDSKSSEKYNQFYNQLSNITSDSYKVMQNPYAMSLAYGVDSKVNDIDIQTSGIYYFERYNNLIGAMLGKPASVSLFKPIYGMTTSHSKFSSVNDISSSIECITKSDKGVLTFSFKAAYTGDYYFYTPTISKTKVSVNFYSRTDEIDTKNRTKITSVSSFLDSDTTHVLWAGHYTEGSYIDVEITVPADKKLKLSKSNSFLWCLDSSVYESSMKELYAGPQFSIDQTSTDDHLTGSIITGKASQTILTTIPFDEGWNVYVDGQKVETYKTLDALMAFDIESTGSHTLEFKYMPSCYKFGAAISIGALLFFIAVCVVDFALKKTVWKNKVRVYENEYWVLDEWDNDEETELDLPLISEQSESIPIKEEIENLTETVISNDDSDMEQKADISDEATSDDSQTN